MSDFQKWIIFTGAWSGIFGYMIGTYLERRANSKLRKAEEKLRQTAMPNRSVGDEIRLVPPTSSALDHFDQGRLTGIVKSLDLELERLDKRLRKLESERESGAA
jgi:ubiquinone biosynthesis protein UbiJ